MPVPIELNTPWRKSSFSGVDSNCVEIAHSVAVAAIRDSKDPDGPYLTFPTPTYRALLAAHRR